jgi:predicted lipoprotein with Yx(FWY)xxD motif
MMHMTQTNPAREALRGIQFRRLVRAGLVGGALSSSIAVAGMAGAATSTTSTVVSTTKTTHFGTILVSSRTVYTLKPSKVACAAQCLSIWPPVLLPKGVTKVKAGSGVNAARLGTVKGESGSRQVTYGRMRLYYFVNDTARGQVNGNLTDEWGKWSVVVTVKPAHSSSGGTPTTSAGSGGVSF